MSPEALRVKAALQGTLTLDVIDQFVDDATQEYIISVSQALWDNDQRNGRDRSLEQIVRSTVKGAYSEIAVYLMLKAAALEPEWNVIDKSKYVHRSQFNHDLRCQGLKLEIKSQSVERDFFSYKVGDESEYKKIKNFRDNWADYDYLIAVKTNYSSTAINSSFTPWLMIDHNAIDPSQDLFTNKGDYGCWFLKMNVCQNRHLLSYI